MDVVHVSFDQKDQSIVLLEKLFNYSTSPTELKQFLGMRTVQHIRSKAKGHSGGSGAQQLAQDVLKQHETFSRHFKYVCGLVSDELKVIEGLFP